MLKEALRYKNISWKCGSKKRNEELWKLSMCG
jgi:hypothetical protein